MRKVFLDELPKWKEGAYKGKINWKECIGHKVKFIYDDIENEVEIIKYHRSNNISYIDIKYNDNTTTMIPGNFSKCQLGELLNKFTKKYKYNIGDIIKKVKSGKLEILDQIRIPKGEFSEKGYIYKCLICGNIDKTFEYHLNNNQGCNVCSKQKILKGYNDLWTTHPEVAELLKYPERGYEITYGINKNEIFICPDCGYEKSLKPFNFISQGFSCPKCGDGISYPNKFIRSFFDQLNEEYIPEYSPDWMGQKRYDNFLPNRKEVWEIHGLQHYSDTSGVYIKTLKEEQENDRIKKELAEQNGLKYIVIDARYSNLKYIKNSLLNLSEIQRYDLSKINWLECHKNACTSLVIIVCDLWSKGITINEISNKYKIDRSTVRKYLKQGTELLLCNYNAKKQLSEIKMKKIICLNNNMVFNSITEAAEKYNLSASSISACCKGKRKSAGKHSATGEKLQWMYYDEYIKQQNKSA